ncbi:unnamed protein product [Heligmosomoides polygyrus]|uniref:Reverse transcriptase domain-containing protein n=1 Tax=Heligmosomoides polygyrus TaxID=6339 RepID=A0A183GE27_HELPZ|nr:unnamed protein product [Heligmosomoides polygyrus]
MKISERIHDSRLREIVTLSDNQCSFVAGCGTIDAMHAALLLVEKHHEKQKPVHITFLDLDNAFDRVVLKNLSLSLGHCLMLITYCSLVKIKVNSSERAVVRPIAMNDVECWPAIKEVEARLSVMETKVLRCTAGVTRMDRIRNDVIRQKFGVVPIADKMRKARLR